MLSLRSSLGDLLASIMIDRTTATSASARRTWVRRLSYSIGTNDKGEESLAEQGWGPLGLELVASWSLIQRRHSGMVRRTGRPQEDPDRLGQRLWDLRGLYGDPQGTDRKQTSNMDI